LNYVTLLYYIQCTEYKSQGDKNVPNTWYVACTPDEIDGKPLGRTICGEKIVFYRGAQGKVAAVEDFCPHRGAPLSLGLCAMAAGVRLSRPGDGLRW
jgi:phenylpropionate dioxygenase-like ring-hydroxylating dioxygenase large terminal subunit